MTLHNAPPTHTLTIAVALILDAIVIYGVVFSLLVIRGGRREGK